MKDFEDTMLDIAWKNLDSENNRFKDIDAKAIGVITITGILMTFLAKPANSGTVSNILFATTSLSFLVTIYYSVLVIKTRQFNSLSTNNLISKFRDKKQERQIRGIIGTIAKAEQNLRDVCNLKAEQLRKAVAALGLSIILLILYSLSAFF